MLTVEQECSPLIELDCGNISAVTFGANGEYVVSGGENGIRVWGVEDGKQMATMEARKVRCIAVSKDGGWIATGNSKKVVVWDAKTYEKSFTVLKESGHTTGVDFSPDSTRLVTASFNGRSATVWDIATRKPVVGPLRHEKAVRTAKFSLQGDRIATATLDSVRVYDSSDGRLLLDITVKVTPLYNNGLLWSKAHLFVLSDDKVKQIDAATGSAVSEWLVPGGGERKRIALATYGDFIAHSIRRTVTFWDASTHTQLGLIKHPEDILSIALSSDDQFIAIGGKGGKMTIKRLSRINIVGVVACCITYDVIYLNTLFQSSFHIETNPFGSSPPHFPGTRHSDQG